MDRRIGAQPTATGACRGVPVGTVRPQPHRPATAPVDDLDPRWPRARTDAPLTTRGGH